MFSVLPFTTGLFHDIPTPNKVSSKFKSWQNQNEEPGSYLEKLPKHETRKLRNKYIGNICEIHYGDEPIKIVRGQGAYLYDELGNRYLDCINNVTHVGHCHPHVVEACNNQMKMLNTNNRFLHDSIVQYAERITATLPSNLTVCNFTCTGLVPTKLIFAFQNILAEHAMFCYRSEANELALVMARQHTGHEDIIVLQHAYHGHTSLLLDLSTYKQKQMNKECNKEFVHVVPTPDVYRGKYQGNDEYIGEKYANEVKLIIDEAHKNGRKIAAFLVESAQGCGGQIIYPSNYLKLAFKYVREAGGVCIADEVQTGFGRIGDHFWTFQEQDVQPDIVTMGKPIANGHPVSLVVTTQAIADSAKQTGFVYFNTFGGNPVSCEIAHAVLDVLEEENLMENARNVGNYMLKSLKELQEVHPLIGDVRGKGFYMGVELVTDCENKTPATKEAKIVKNKMKEKFIIISMDGPDSNVLKIKPPMCFSENDAEFLIFTLNKVLAEVELTREKL